jgi:hypothetical protein
LLLINLLVLNNSLTRFVLRVLDAELVENSGAALSQSALDLVTRSSDVRASNGRLQREAFINVRFVSE